MPITQKEIQTVNLATIKRHNLMVLEVTITVDDPEERKKFLDDLEERRLYTLQSITRAYALFSEKALAIAEEVLNV